MKKFMSGLIIGIVITLSMSVFADNITVKVNPFPVLVNGVRQAIGAYNINGSTYIKLSDVAKATEGAVNVMFDGDSQIININTVNQDVNVDTVEAIEEVIEEAIGQNRNDLTEAYINGPFDPIIENDIEYYPIRWVEDSIYDANYRIYYNEEVKVLYIIHNDLPGRPLTENKTVLEKIPFKVFEGRTYIEKNYYNNTILPLVQ